jgi:hypothetical protein
MGRPQRHSARLVAWCAAVLPLLMLLPAGAASAQTILNTERFQLAEVRGLHAAVDASVSGALGNVRVVNASSSGIVGYRGARHWPRLIGGGRFLADRQRRLLDDRFLQLRYGYIFSERTDSFHFWQLQANRSLLLQRRMLLGSGARTALLHGGTTSLHLGTGLMYEAEDRNPERLESDEPASLRTWRLANQAVARHRLAGGATIRNITYFQPAVDRPADFRLLNELGLAVPVADPVNLSVTLEWRHDSRPPAALRRDDLAFRTGLRIDLR